MGGVFGARAARRAAAEATEAPPSTKVENTSGRQRSPPFLRRSQVTRKSLRMAGVLGSAEQNGARTTASLSGHAETQLPHSKNALAIWTRFRAQGGHG